METGSAIQGITLEPIGIVRCPHATREDLAVQGVDATLEIRPDLTSALDGIERCSHIVVLGWLHRSDRTVTRCRPRRLRADAEQVGVFAARSPDRPNPISVTVVPLIRRDGHRLHVRNLDLLDGTPILDLKSYNPGWDGVFSAHVRARTRSAALEPALLVAFLARDLDNHLGPDATSPPARLALAATVTALRMLNIDGRDPALSASVRHADASLDAVIGLLGATFASGRVALDPAGPDFAFTCGGSSLRLWARDRAAPLPEDPAAWVDRFVIEPNECAVARMDDPDVLESVRERRPDPGRIRERRS